MTVAYYLFTNEQNARIRLPQCSYCTVHARAAKESLSFYLLGNEFFSWKPSLNASLPRANDDCWNRQDI